MFQELKKQKNIVVTSPQRAGSRIVAKMIAEDTGFTYIDEKDIAVDNLESLKDVLTGNVVVQAPGIMRWIHEIDCYPVIVKRAVKDIVKSQERISWGHEPY